MSPRPVIGLTAYCEEARWAYWHRPAVLLPANYGEQVAAAGGIPVLLPPVPGIAGAVDRIDGLLLTGGGDIDPARYGAQPHPATVRVSGPRDAAELELLDAAAAAGKPVLGVCRGMQLVNVARGGTLTQHLPGDGGHAPAPGTFGSHPVRVAAGPQAEPVDRGRGPVPLDEIADLDGGRLSHARECRGTSGLPRRRPGPRSGAGPPPPRGAIAPPAGTDHQRHCAPPPR